MTHRIGSFILHRHGHRAPARNIFKPASSAWGNSSSLTSSSDGSNSSSHLDAELWRRMRETDVYSDRRFPIALHEDLPAQSDVVSAPYGQLTTKGFQHMVSVGRLLADKYQLSIASYHPNKSNIANVQSTNYTRTQTSALAVLTGIASRNQENTSESNILLPIRTIQQKNCSMSFYERDHLLAKKLVLNVQSLSRFKDLMSQSKYSRIVTDMSAAFPNLIIAPTTQGDSSSSLSSSYSRFDWLASFDYYICRKAHGLDVILPEFEGDIQLVVSQRYKLYFSHLRHLAYFIVPLLFDFIKHAVSMSISSNSNNNNSSSSSSNSNVISNSSNNVIFSGHDVNILGLLHALGYRQIASDPSFWPGFGSHVALEVFCSNTSSSSSSSSLGNSNSSSLISSTSSKRSLRDLRLMESMPKVNSCIIANVKVFLELHKADLEDLVDDYSVQVAASFEGKEVPIVDLLSRHNGSPEMVVSHDNELFLSESYYKDASRISIDDGDDGDDNEEKKKKKKKKGPSSLLELVGIIDGLLKWAL